MDASPQQIAWAAGLFEGEGCITNRKASGKWARRLALVMRDEDVVRRFQTVVGAGAVHPRRSRQAEESGWSSMWVWELNRWSELEPTLRALLPYLGDRRAEAAMALLANPPKWTHRRSDDECAHGHSLTGPNLYVNPKGVKICRACKAINDRRHRERQKEKV